MEKFNVQVKSILDKVNETLVSAFAKEVGTEMLLLTAKSLGYVKGKRGRDGGTFATPEGMAFAGLEGSIIRPMTAKERRELGERLVAQALGETPQTETATA